MTYLDTNVIVSYINEKDPLHEKALKVVNSLNKRTISKLVVLELYSVFSRVSGLQGLELDALVEYSIEATKSELKDVDLNEAFSLAMEYSGALKLKTLDLLHIIIASMIDDSIATFDNDIIKREKEILKLLGIRVVKIP